MPAAWVTMLATSSRWESHRCERSGVSVSIRNSVFIAPERAFVQPASFYSLRKPAISGNLAPMNSDGKLLAAGVAGISPLFALLTLVLVFAVLVSLVLVKFKQSLLVGYLLSGVLIGNIGLLWLTGMERGDPVIHNLAEIGVVLLMFTLGIEFSLTELSHLWRTALVGGGLQVGITATVVGLLAAAFGFPTVDCIVLGIAVALSSTAVAMKSFQDLGQQNNPGARASLGIALFQDVLVILVFLVLPALYQQGNGGVGLAGRNLDAQGRRLPRRGVAARPLRPHAAAARGGPDAQPRAVHADRGGALRGGRLRGQRAGFVAGAGGLRRRTGGERVDLQPPDSVGHPAVQGSVPGDLLRVGGLLIDLPWWPPSGRGCC